VAPLALVAGQVVEPGDGPGRWRIARRPAYGTGELRHHLADQDMTALMKPPPLRPAIEGGCTLDDFTIDETGGTATCPPCGGPGPA
jgi:hypothetical protein